MYESVRIQNFRGFEDLTVNGLKRVNLIVGENGVGKTALLEAVYLLLTGPDFNIGLDTIHLLRGLSEALPRDEMDEGLTRSFFRSFDTNHGIALRATYGGSADALAIKAVYERAKLSLVGEWQFAGASGQLSYDPEHNVWGGWRSAPPEPRVLPSFLGTQRSQRALRHEADQFTKMRQAGQKDRLTGTLQVLDSRVRDLELLTIGNAIAVHADVGQMQSLPVALLGEGSQRILSLLMAIGSAPSKLIADEIDTGLHYSVLPDMWKAVGRAVRDFDCQLFATTHSFECMTAAYEAFEDHPEDFSMHRLERVRGELVCKSFGHETLGNALTMGLEVR